MRDDKGRARVSKKPWFTEVSHMCAIPRAIPACAPTVEFLGICEHSQVVNYLQWNFMLNLCGGVYPYAGPMLRKAWNLKEYGTTAPNETQAHMSEIAEQILDRLEDNPDETDFSDIKEALQDLDAGLDQKPIRECELTCKVKIDTPFDYRWIGLTRGRPYQTLRLDRDAEAGAKAFDDMLRAKASAAGMDKYRPGKVLDEVRDSLGRD